MANEIIKTSDYITDLYNQVSGLIEQARSYVKTSVNTAEVYTKYYIGKYIVEYEQKGNVRAQYGKRVLKELSQKLIVHFEEGWSVDTLEKWANCSWYIQIPQHCYGIWKSRANPQQRCGFLRRQRLRLQIFFFHGLII